MFFDFFTKIFALFQESAEVEARRGVVAIQEEEAGEHVARAQVLREECQVELNKALPALYG